MYVYKRPIGATDFSFAQKLVPTDARFDGQVGRGVAYDNNVILVAARQSSTQDTFTANIPTQIITTRGKHLSGTFALTYFTAAGASLSPAYAASGLNPNEEQLCFPTTDVPCNRLERNVNCVPCPSGATPPQYRPIATERLRHDVSAEEMREALEKLNTGHCTSLAPLPR